MIGIKGVGMTMLAQYLAGIGKEVAGSDTGEKFMTDAILDKSHIKYFEEFKIENIPGDADLIIYSTAYSAERNIEVKKALAGKIKTMTYAEAVGAIFNQRFGIAVVGSHGKTTTSAWLGYVLDRAGLEPSVMVGSYVPQFEGASLVGKSDYLVIEADEYQNKFKHFNPQAALLNNIDYDHPDFFPTAEDYSQAFVDFIGRIPAKGWLVANFDDPIIRKTARVNCRGRVISYAINESADYVAHDIKIEKDRQFFKVKLGVNDIDDEEEFSSIDSQLGDFSIQMPGRHNIYNALAVIAAAIELGVDLVDIRKHLEGFTGTARRMQIMGEFRGSIIIDDYAHHPTEVKATLEALKTNYPGKFLRIIFHPHTYTRTKALLDDFAKSFSGASEVAIVDIYGSAREVQGGVSSQDLVDKVCEYNEANGIEQKVLNIHTLPEVEEYLRDNVERGEVVALMGAGDIFRVGENLTK